MALAIASGSPQFGLYTAIIAGFLIACMTGGSRFGISGPTAAFVVIPVPVIAAIWLPSGLLMAGLMAGFILVGMALHRLGRYIEYIPRPLPWVLPGGIAVYHRDATSARTWLGFLS